MADVAIERLGKRFASPVVLASGPAGFGMELQGEIDLSCIGALTAKTVTPMSRIGNPQPRLIDCACGALNSIGLENPGFKVFRESILPVVLGLPTQHIVSLSAPTADQLAWMAAELASIDGICAVELNLSCPNVSLGVVGADPVAVREYVEAARVEGGHPVLVKLPGDAGDLLASAGAALDAGAAGLTLINTVRGMRINRNSGQPFLHRAYGGLCGPAILPIALARVFEARQAFPDTVIIGTGGVTDVGSLVEMLLAGADLVGLGFGLMADPELPQRLHGELNTWLTERGIGSVEEIIGAAHQGGIDVH